MAPYTDEQIIKGIFEKNDRVIGYVYKTYFGKIQGFLLKKGGRPEQIEDIFQDAMLIIYKKIRKEGLRLSCSFSTYLSAVCKNLYFQEIRTNRYQSVESTHFENLVQETGPDPQFEEKLISLFNYHFGNLSEDCKKLLRLHINKTPLADIVRIMGYTSEHYVSDKKYRCKESLYRRIRNDPAYNDLKNGV